MGLLAGEIGEGQQRIVALQDFGDIVFPVRRSQGQLDGAARVNLLVILDQITDVLEKDSVKSHGWCWTVQRDQEVYTIFRVGVEYVGTSGHDFSRAGGRVQSTPLPYGFSR